MSGKVWFSSFMSNYLIGSKQGLRSKFRGEDWEPPQHRLTAESDKLYAAVKRHGQGYPLTEDDLPEAVAVFDSKSFNRVGELFVAGRFYAVRNSLAKALGRFDFGEGGLIPFNIYKEDLISVMDEQFYYLNFGARKKTFLPSESKNVTLVTLDPMTDLGIYRLNSDAEHGDVAVSTAALCGADLWVEAEVKGSLFLSGSLADALSREKLKIDLKLTECLIIENKK